MPISRYEIRNEYSLADPELYRAADKDDPEALLEGVAMAGLVGVLRQLGDLAEFAAEIFHDLHEEVMATAARGHGLMIRVQQLESEVPFIEKAFLSQTDHSPYFYNAGIDWHSNLRMEQNLVTQGDLPRFIMDSYEECRGPPRLFLLDKFDVAGAGACLKRYTDPSFCKVETYGMTRSDVRREKIRKAKKKGPRWRNGENPEVLSTSNAKLHQLFMEERVGTVVGNPERRVKLKRRLNGFPFDSVTGRGYMEKLLKNPSPQHKVLHEVDVNSSPLVLPTNNYNESRLEVPDVRTVDTGTESVRRSRSVSPGREEIMQNLSVYEPSKTSKDDVTREVRRSYHDMVKDEITSTSEKLTGEKNMALDGEHKTEGTLTGYQSDEIASEMDNYVDAPSTMESEMDTDSEVKVKSDFTFKFIRNQPFISDANEESNHIQLSDSQSTGDSIISDEGNNSSKKETSSFSSSDSPITSAEKPHSELEKGFASADSPDVDIVDAPTHERITDVELHVNQQSISLVPDDSCPSAYAIPNHRSDFEQLPSSLAITDLQSTMALSNSGVLEKDRIRRPELNEVASVSDDEEKKINLFTNPPCSPSVSDFTSQRGDGSQISSAEEHAGPKGEDIPFIHHAAGNSYHTERLIIISSDLLHEDECNCEDLNPVENIASTSNMSDVLSCNKNDTLEVVPLKNSLLYNMDDEVPEFPENISADCPDIVHSGENIKSMFSKGEKQSEASLACSHSVDTEEDYSNRSISNQISSENLYISHVEKSLDWPGAVLNSHDRNGVPEEETTVNETPTLGTLESFEDGDFQGPGATDELNPKNQAALESLRGSPENFEEPGPSDSIENDEIATYKSSIGVEVNETVGPADLKLLNEVHVPLNESDTDQLEAADMVSHPPAVSDNANRIDVCLHVSPDKWVADQTPCPEDVDMGKLGGNENCLSGTLRKSSLLDEVSESEAISSDSNGVFINNFIDNHLNSEASDIVSDPNLYSDADHSLELVDSTAVQSAMEQSGLYAEQETLLKSGSVNHVSDDPSHPIIVNTKEIAFQEEIELPSNRLDEDLLDSGEVNPGLTPLLPINNHQILDHDDYKGDNNSAQMFSRFNHASPLFSSELPELHNNNLSGCTKDSIDSIFPPTNHFSETPTNHFSETNQVNLDELPPLPPLPPVQWRVGKLQHASPITEEETVEQELFPQVISSPIVPTDVEMNHSLVQFTPETSLKEEKVEHILSNLEASALSQTTGLQQEIENEPRQPSTSTGDGSTLEETNHPVVQIDHETAPIEEEHSSSSVETCGVNDLQPKVEKELQQPWAPNTDVSSSLEESLEEMNNSLVQINTETASERENIQQNSSSLEASPMSETVDLPPKIENKQLKPVMSFSVSELTPPAEEGVSNENSTVKLPRPHDPLMDVVAAIDKSRLKKVTDRVLPEIQKVDERDSLLQQIRTKSFNLRPAVASRPSIRGPNTNLKVAAILEKANAIRQALTGSDEDDDNWSDS